MKTMQLWRIAFMMLAAFSLASCKQSGIAERCEGEGELVEYRKAELHRLHHRTGDTGYTAEMVERIKYYLCID